MSFQRCRRLPRATRLVWVWCLLVAVPFFGVSGTLVELLGSNHVHRIVAFVQAASSSDPMRGWADIRRAPATFSAYHGHSHDGAGFARHHHDRNDASVVSIDGGPQGEAADEGGTSAGSLSHVLALPDLAHIVVLSPSRFAWPAATAAAVKPWTTDGPLRPPKT